MDLTPGAAARRLHSLLDDAPPGEATQRAALEAVSGLGAPGQIVPVLRALREDPQIVAARAVQSYRHPLGFDKLELIDAAPRFILRLHIWWPDRPRGTEDVHNHRYAPASAILHGGYEMQVFQSASHGAVMAEFREEYTVHEASWRLDPIGEAHLTLTAMSKLTSGDSYVLAADTLHRVAIAPEVACVTLFLETAPIRSTTQIFTEAGSPTRPVTPKLPLRQEGYLQILARVLAVLEN
ncbi:MAG TPA: hypothetical protein VGI74_12710 [Streptosporangiaceae bacterium]